MENYGAILAKRKVKKRLGKRAAKNVHVAAIKLGKMGGDVGGFARAAALNKYTRSEIAIHAANMRWGNKCDCSYCGQV